VAGASGPTLRTSTGAPDEHTTVLTDAAIDPQSTAGNTHERRPRHESADPLAGAAGQPSGWDRLALASGAIFVVVILALAPLAPLPLGPDATTAQLSDWFETHRAAVLLQASLRGVAGLLQLIFMASLVGVVARAQGSVGTLALLVFGGALGGTLMVLLSNTAIATTALVVGPGTEAGVIRGLDTLGRMLTTFDDSPWALGYGAASLALLRIRAVPTWLGCLGILAALLLVVHAATGPSVGASSTLAFMLALLGFALSLVWLVATSSALLWRSRARVSTLG
jgi:hypothetical protein